MATTPIPTPAAPAVPGVALTLTDPISADVQVALQALTALCQFACTPEGQKLIGTVETDVNAANNAVAKAIATIAKWLHIG